MNEVAKLRALIARVLEWQPAFPVESGLLDELANAVKGSNDMGEVSDGYHTFNELYDHRCHLFVALMLAEPLMSWRSRKHADGSEWTGWFIAGMHIPSGDITYHLPETMWTLLDDELVTTYEKAPAWDGHTSVDVVKRLRTWIEAPSPHDGLVAVSCEHGYPKRPITFADSATEKP